MTMAIIFWSSLSLIAGATLFTWLKKSAVVVPEDHHAVVVDRRGFIRRVLPAGVYHLKPGLERVEFILPTKTKLIQGCGQDIATAEGIHLTVYWSGIYTPRPDWITENVSQRLRGLPNAERTIQRKAALVLRRLLGAYTLRELFKPAIRARIERQLSAALRSDLRSSGIGLNGLDLEGIIPPVEVSAALNQAQAIQALDTVIRSSDVATREIVTGAHKLEELMALDDLLPPYGKYTLLQPALKEH